MKINNYIRLFATWLIGGAIFITTFLLCFNFLFYKTDTENNAHALSFSHISSPIVYGNKQYQNANYEWVNLYTFDLEVGGNKALCASPEKKLPEQNFEETYDSRNLNLTYVKRVMYLYTTNPSAVESFYPELSGYTYVNIYHSLFLNFGDGVGSDPSDASLLDLIWQDPGKSALIGAHQAIYYGTGFDFSGIDDYTLHIATGNSYQDDYTPHFQLVAWLTRDVAPTYPGTLTITKTSANPSVTNGNSYYTTSGATYGIYSDYACTQLVQSVVTGANGSVSVSLDPGTYYVKEIQPPNGYYLDSATVTTVVVSSGSTQSATVSNLPKMVEVGVQKLSSSPSTTDNNSNYELNGAEFQICGDSNCNTILGNVTTNSAGQSTTKITLAAGIYYAKEITAPKGFHLNNNIASSEFTPGASGFISITDTPIAGGVSISKTDSDFNSASPQGNARLDGAEFTIYRSDNTSVKTITTNSSGTASTGTNDLAIGSYYIKETKAPTGYKISDKRIDFTISASDDGIVKNLSTDSFSEQVIRGNVRIQKCDAETRQCSPIGGGSFEGVTFALKNSSTNAVMINGRTYQPGDSLNLTVHDGWASLSGLPYGSYTLSETASSASYLVNPSEKQFNIQSDGETVTLDSGNAFYNRIKRNDLKLIKTDDEDKPFAGIVFKITQKETGETHIVVTNEDGIINTGATRHSSNTNFNDIALTEDALTEAGVIDPSLLDPTAGIWFGKDTDGNTAPVNDDYAALPYGTYDLEELRTNNNGAYELISRTFTIDSDSSIDNTLDLGTIENKIIKTPDTGLITHQPASAKAQYLLGFGFFNVFWIVLLLIRRFTKIRHLFKHNV